MFVTFKDSEKHKGIDVNHHKMQNITYDEMIKVSKDTNSDGFILYAYYHSKPQRWKWNDTAICNDLGWSKSKLDRIRRLLVHRGWMYRYRSGKHMFTYVGPYNAIRGRLDEAIDNGFSNEEAIASVLGSIDNGELVTQGELPEYFKYYFTSIGITDIDFERLDYSRC